MRTAWTRFALLRRCKIGEFVPLLTSSPPRPDPRCSSCLRETYCLQIARYNIYKNIQLYFKKNVFQVFDYVIIRSDTSAFPPQCANRKQGFVDQFQDYKTSVLQKETSDIRDILQFK